MTVFSPRFNGNGGAAAVHGSTQWSFCPLVSPIVEGKSITGEHMECGQSFQYGGNGFVAMFSAGFMLVGC